MTQRNHRGSVLAVALLIILIMLVMAVAFTYETRTQSHFNSAVKLHGFYRTAAENILQDTLAALSDEWVTATVDTLGTADNWRLSRLFKGVPDDAKYGFLYKSGSNYKMNANLIDLDYKVFVQNNSDDPAYYMKDVNIGTLVLDETWDTDGKAVVTVQVFQPGDSRPLVTITTLAQATGVGVTFLGLDIGSEGSDVSSNLNDGQGSDDAGNNPGGDTSSPGLKPTN